MGSTPTICAISVVESKDFTADIFLFAASNYNVVSLRKGYYKPKLLATKIRSQKPFVARIVAHSS